MAASTEPIATRRAGSCPVCDSQDVVARQLGATRLLECRACTVRFVPTVRAPDPAYYAEQYRMTPADYASTEHRRWFRMPEQVSLVADLARRRPPPGRVLDVGCDKGYFLDEMRRFGYTVRGVEPSGAARAYCASVGIETTPSLEGIQGEFDIVSMWHVLEHVPEPVEFLRRLFALLAPAGVMAIRVPDAGSRWARVLRERWIWFQPRNHCVHYTERALKVLVERCGGRMIELRSRKAHTDLTRRAGGVAASTVSRYLGARRPLRKVAGQLVEEATGVELFAIASRA